MKKSTLDRIRRRVNAEIDKLGSEDSPDSIDELEDLALRLRQRAGEIAAEEMSRELAGESEEPSQKEACSCGRWARFKGEHEHQVVTMSGTARISRRYYYCRRCDAGFCPGDRRLGCVGTSFSLRVRQETARLSSLASSHKLSVELLYDLAGVSVSESQAQRIVAEAGVWANCLFDERRDAALTDLSVSKLGQSPSVLYLEADGVLTPTVTGYKETKIGVALASDEKGTILSQGYTSHLGNCEEFGEHWYALARRFGLSNAGRVVILGDGAKWLWNQADHHFPKALQIVDFWHVMEHLGGLARAAFGEGTVKAREWLAERGQELRSSAIDSVLSSLRALAERLPALLEQVIGELDYLISNRKRMDYARYLEMGLRIGSGAVESACKRLVSLRLKGPGMRWRQQTAQTIARLRCLFYSGEWQDLRTRWQAA